MKYEVQVDVTMGMRIEVDADSKDNAYRKIKDKQYVPSDLQNAWHVANDIVEISKVSDE